MDELLRNLYRRLTLDPEDREARTLLNSLRQRLGQLVSADPDNLEVIGAINQLRLISGEEFPAIRINGHWIEVKRTDIIFEPDRDHRYPETHMGIIELENGREFYYFAGDDGLEILLGNIQSIQEDPSLIGNYSYYDQYDPEIEKYTSEDLHGEVNEPGWYYNYDAWGDYFSGPYDTEEEVQQAFYDAYEDVVPSAFRTQYTQQAYNAETVAIWAKHPGLWLEYDEYNEPEDDENDLNEKIMKWIDHDFQWRDVPDTYWLVPVVEPDPDNPRETPNDLPQWIWKYAQKS